MCVMAMQPALILLEAIAAHATLVSKAVEQFVQVNIHTYTPLSLFHAVPVHLYNMILL